MIYYLQLIGGLGVHTFHMFFLCHSHFSICHSQFVFQNEDLSPEEYQQRRTELLNRQQLELADLDRRHSDEQKQIEKGALTDWEVKFARAKLDEKEKHYKVSHCWQSYSKAVFLNHSPATSVIP